MEGGGGGRTVAKIGLLAVLIDGLLDAGLREAGPGAVLASMHEDSRNNHLAEGWTYI